MKHHKTKDIVSYYFMEMSSVQFKCNICGIERKQDTAKGFENLKDHLKRDHPTYATDYSKLQGDKRLSLDYHGFIKDKTINTYGWINWVISRNLPFCEVDNEETRKYSNLTPIASKTMKSCMDKLTLAVEKKISIELPDIFGIVFDGWTDGSIHYIGIFALYEINNISKKPFLSIAPPLEEDDYSANSYIDFIISTLNIYGKTIQHVAFFVGDNCAVNVSVSKKTGIPLIGCASHKLNLAVNDYLKTYEHVIKKVNVLMKQLKTCKNRAKLRKVTDIYPVCKNVTRWSSTFEMIRRYLQIKGKIVLIEEVIQYLLTKQENEQLEELMVNLKDIESVTKCLQSDDLNLSDARDLFNALQEKFPSMKKYLASDANVVVNPNFESGIIKILDNQQDTLTSDEEKEIQVFRLTNPVEISTNDKNLKLGFAERILLKKRKLNCSENTGKCESKYMSLSFISSTSNIVERLFSNAKHILTDTRRRMLPINFEMLLFLKSNKKLWDLSTLSKAMKY